MLYKEIIAVCYQIHTKHINTLCGLNVEFVDVKPSGTYSDHWAVSFKLTVILSYNVFVSQLLVLPHLASLCCHLLGSVQFVYARGYVQNDRFSRLVWPRHWFCKF
jgi:hypothetical protein